MHNHSLVDSNHALVPDIRGFQRKVEGEPRRDLGCLVAAVGA